MRVCFCCFRLFLQYHATGDYCVSDMRLKTLTTQYYVSRKLQTHSCALRSSRGHMLALCLDKLHNCSNSIKIVRIYALILIFLRFIFFWFPCVLCCSVLTVSSFLTDMYKMCLYLYISMWSRPSMNLLCVQQWYLVMIVSVAFSQHFCYTHRLCGPLITIKCITVNVKHVCFTFR